MSGQAGPVQPGQPEREPIMDLDRALLLFQEEIVAYAVVGDVDDFRAALAAFKVLVQRARAYVKSPDSQRLALLASVLQEPVKEPARSESDAAVADRWLTEHNMLAITRQAAHRLGILNGP